MSSAPGGAIGPTDRESFYKAQKRNRRATWRMSFLCVVAALIMGVPLTLVLTPLFYAGTLVVLEIVNYFFYALPQEFWDNANTLGRLALQIGDYFINGKGQLDPPTIAMGLAIVLLPGIVITFILWLATLALFRRGGVGGALASLNARDPDKNDLKELQLADVVEEMSIAAGLTTPRVMLVDSPGANAAAIGTSPLDARLVICRRLLDDLDRNQLQAVLAHLIASIGNGDLRVAFTVTSVFETCGLIITLINSPFGRESRRTLWRVVRYGFIRSSSDAARAAEAETVASMLAGNLEMGAHDIDRFFDSDQPNRSLLRKLLSIIFFPILFTNMAIEITLWFFLNVLLGPCMALVWRTRRYLADASAVQLTRNPDALADALQCLASDDTTVPGGAWASHLFLMNPRGESSMSSGRSAPTQEQLQQAAEAWRASADTGSSPAGAMSGAPNFNRLRSEIAATAFAAFRGNAQATARLEAFRKALLEKGVGDASQIPDIAELAAAVRGDRAAMGRLRAVKQEQQSQAKRGQTGLQTQSFLSFHPPLKRRLRRLNRMGAHAVTPVMGRGSKVALAVAFLIVGPLLLAAAAMMLVAIAMMITLNLAFLALWLTAIHGIFWWLIHR